MCLFPLSRFFGYELSNVHFVLLFFPGFLQLYATELLAVLLQKSPANQKLLGETEGVLALLMAASHYKRKDPQVICIHR